MVTKCIALVAHDKRKLDLLEWARNHRDALSGLRIVATGTAGRILSEELSFPVERLLSGPLGGDQQIGSKIACGDIDMLIFFWDPLEPMPHDSDVKALLRIASLWNVPVACNRASADYMISSPLLCDAGYVRARPDFASYVDRDL